MISDSILAERLLDTALELGETTGWEALHLHQLADRAGVSLAELHRCYRQKDELVDAWLDRADRAMLETQPDPALSPPARLESCLSKWLESLATHRTLTRQMLAYKLEFGHVHLQAALITRISRTVQWWREAARRDQLGLDRIVDEVTLSSIFVGNVSHFLFDDSTDFGRTRQLLHVQLMTHHAASLAGQSLCQSLHQTLLRPWRCPWT